METFNHLQRYKVTKGNGIAKKPQVTPGMKLATHYPLGSEGKATYSRRRCSEASASCWRL